MAAKLLSSPLKAELLKFLKANRKAELVQAYLFYAQEKFGIQPVLVPKEKLIYQSMKEALRILEEQGKLWRETEIKIRFSKDSVNEDTARVYICPFSGKVFGDNTHSNPQDAIYEWVSTCPENTETIDGLRVKRFFVSEDPEVIRSYIKESKRPITKIVYSSAVSGKLFHNKDTVVKDFRDNYTKTLSLPEVQSQNRFSIEDSFLVYLQDLLEEDRLASFVSEMEEDEAFHPYLERWFAEEEAAEEHLAEEEAEEEEAESEAEREDV